MSGVVDWNDDSLLSRNGYSADGSLTETGRKIVLDKIIINNDPTLLLGVIAHFKWLIEDRGQRMPNAMRIWEDDLVYFCNRMNQNLGRN